MDKLRVPSIEPFKTGRGSASAAARRLAGAIGSILVVAVAACGSFADNGSGGGEGATPAVTRTATPPQERRETLYVHSAVDVHTGAGNAYTLVRTLTRGERIEVGEGDADGWARLYGDRGGIAMYVLRASDRLRAYPPASEPKRRHPRGATAICADSTYSYSRHRTGTCSRHGGAIEWL
jgi:hypothetical protein